MALLPIACFLALCAFLGCLGLFALAVTKVASPDGRGHTRGFAGGCAAVLALFLLCGLGLTGLAASVAAIGVGSFAEWNPIRRIEVSRLPARAAGPGEGRGSPGEVAARFTVRAGAGGDLVELLHDLLDLDLSELGDRLTIQPRTGPDGDEFSVYEFRLPLTEAELERFERDVRRELDRPEVHLPGRVAIEFEDSAKD